MDHHYHHHQQQWRPRPLPGNICPTCSASHFPFCPPHPSFYQSPRFPFDPYRGPTGPPLPFTDGFGDPRPWVRNPSLDSGEPYGQFQSESYSNGFVNESDRNPKKPRIDDIQRNQNAVRMSFEDERRLKLIREHGSVLGGLLPEGVAGTMPGMNRGMNGDVQESSAFDVNYGRPGVGEFGKFDGSRESMSELGPIGPRNMEFYDPRFGSGDRRGQPNRQSSRNGFQNAELSHSRHGRDESSLHSFQTYGIKNVDQTHLPYPVSEVPADNYLNTHNPRQWQISDSMPANEPPYSHTTNWQGTRLPHPERRDSVPKDNRDSNSQLQHPYGIQYPGDLRHDSHSSGLPSDARQPLEDSFPSRDGKQGPIWHQSMSGVTQHGAPNFNEHGGYFQLASGGSMPFENTGQMEASRFYNRKPPVPASPPPLPPPPPPTYPALRPSSELIAFVSPPKTTASLFPVPVGSLSKVPSSYPPIPEAHSLTMPYASTGFLSEAMGDGKPFPLKQLSTDKPKVVDASQLFKPPHRATRPDHIVIILRGLPGSGKSYLAKMLRDLEVENGGHAPRIHSIDDYFMTEVEKVEEGDIAKSSISVRGKKPIKKKVMEYCYEPEMEEAYRSSMLKAFKKTLEEGVFTFIIVDDRNLRVADFAQFWAFAKSSGYEVYILEATYKDPVGCAARNVHGFTKDNIEKMARQWEEAPCLYLQLDVKSLFHGDDLKESGIQEVEMDMEDGDFDGNLSELTERKPENIAAPPVKEDSPDDVDSLKDGNRWDSEGGHPREEVKEIGRSKWSADLDGDLTERTEGVKGNINALSGLIQAYAKEAKSVRWADQVGSTGFSIHAAKKGNVSLVIGPGAGYNLKSNPIPEEEIPAPTRDASESKRQSVFQERLRAERESFKVVFDRRRQRIGRLDLEEE